MENKPDSFALLTFADKYLSAFPRISCPVGAQPFPKKGMTMFPLSPNFPSRRPFYYNRANRRELGSKEELSPTTMLPRGLALFWAVVGTLKGLFFTMAAYLQHNDPDPHLWIVSYAYTYLKLIRPLWKSPSS